jgi:hypothetical protein
MRGQLRRPSIEGDLYVTERTRHSTHCTIARTRPRRPTRVLGLEKTQFLQKPTKEAVIAAPFGSKPIWISAREPKDAIALYAPRRAPGLRLCRPSKYAYSRAKRHCRIINGPRPENPNRTCTTDSARPAAYAHLRTANPRKASPFMQSLSQHSTTPIPMFWRRRFSMSMAATIATITRPLIPAPCRLSEQHSLAATSMTTRVTITAIAGDFLR